MMLISPRSTLQIPGLSAGIHDMEAGRELPLEDAFRKITELRDARRNARI